MSAPNVGAPCDIAQDAGPTQSALNTAAIQCTSHICLKPVVTLGATDTLTAAFCSALCSQDSDCVGETADPLNPLDRRCTKGFSCGILYVKGKLCCQKVCTCKDFLGGITPVTPLACQGDAAATCSE